MSTAAEQLVSTLRDAHLAIARFIQEQERQAPPTTPNNRKKLTHKEVRTIREMYRDGYTQRELAVIYDVNPATVSRIIRKVYHR